MIRLQYDVITAPITQNGIVKSSSTSATAVRVYSALIKWSALEQMRERLSNRTTPGPNSASYMYKENDSGHTVWRLRWQKPEHVKAFCESISQAGIECLMRVSFDQQKLVAVTVWTGVRCGGRSEERSHEKESTEDRNSPKNQSAFCRKSEI